MLTLHVESEFSIAPRLDNGLTSPGKNSFSSTLTWGLGSHPIISDLPMVSPTSAFSSSSASNSHGQTCLLDLLHT